MLITLFSVMSVLSPGQFSQRPQVPKSASEQMKCTLFFSNLPTKGTLIMATYARPTNDADRLSLLSMAAVTSLLDAFVATSETITAARA